MNYRSDPPTLARLFPISAALKYISLSLMLLCPDDNDYFHVLLASCKVYLHCNSCSIGFLSSEQLSLALCLDNKFQSLDLSIAKWRKHAITNLLPHLQETFWLALFPCTYWTFFDLFLEESKNCLMYTWFYVKQSETNRQPVNLQNVCY